MVKGRSLTERASLGALSNAVRIVVTMVAGLLITPLIVRALGQELYGVWAMIQQVLGYVQLANLRTTGTIKLTLAVDLHRDDPHYKRQQIGATLHVLARVALVMLAIGAALVWLAPSIIKISPGHASTVRWALGIGVISLVTGELSSIPGNVLRGMNLEYAAMGLSAVVGGTQSVLGMLAVLAGLGMPGLALAAVMADFIEGGTRLYIAKTHVPWLGVEKPTSNVLKVFWAQTIWISFATLGFILQNATDILVVGLVLGPSAAAVFGATGSVLRMITSSMYSFIGAANPGIAALCGRGEWERVEAVRNELHLGSLVATAIVGCGVIAMNHAFVSLWLGANFYGGNGLNLLLVMIAIQSIPLRLDTMLLDSMLKFRERAVLTIITGATGLGLGAVLGLRFGLSGMALGLVTGNMSALVAMSVVIYRNSPLSFARYLAWMTRPVCVLALLFAGAYAIAFDRLTVVNFVMRAVTVGATSAVIMVYVGLGRRQRAALANRFAGQFSAITRYIWRKRA